MKVIAMGYTGTGSSALVHLLKEYDNCCDVDSKNYEHNIFYVPHGLFDLEDILLKNNSMYKSDAAINDFLIAMQNLNDNDYGWFGGYQKRYGTRFMEIVYEFIDSLVIYSRPGGWSNDYKYEFSIVDVMKDSIKFVLGKDVRKFGYRENYLGDNVVRYALPTDEEFYKCGRRFVNDYFEMIGYDKSKLFIFDQILEPQQLYRIAHYFDEDVRFVVFDRDPRDMFLSSKYIWSKSQNYSILPTEIKNFIHFYSRLLASEKIIEDDRILRIHFEDMIYNYDSSVEKIEKFVGKKILGEHKYKKQFFNPEVSIKNTQVFNSNSSWKDEIQIIEESCLKDRLYKFPYTVHANEDEFSDPNPDTSKRD